MAKRFMKPKHFREYGGPSRLQQLGFSANHLKLINLIPVHITKTIQPQKICYVQTAYLNINPESKNLDKGK